MTALITRVQKRLSPGRLLVLLLGGASAVTFLAVTRQVHNGNTTSTDRAISVWLQQHNPPWFDACMRFFTLVGSVEVIACAVVLVVLLALRRRAYTHAIFLAAVVCVSGAANTALKLWFARERPSLLLRVDLPSDYSFPSGHAMVSASAYGMIAIVLAGVYPKLALPLAIGTPLMVLLIGVSRIALGVHWPTDVVAGFAAGGLVLLGGAVALNQRSRHTEQAHQQKHTEQANEQAGSQARTKVETEAEADV